MVETFEHHRIALVHAVDLHALFTAGWACRWAHIPVVVHIHRQWDYYPRRYRPLLARAARLIFVSRYVQGAFASISPMLARDRGTVILNAISIPKEHGTAVGRHQIRNELGLRPDEAVVGIVGRLQDIKGHDIFLHAAREVVKVCSKVRFLVVGHPGNSVANQQYAQGLMELTERLGLTDRVVFTGFRSDVNDIMTLLDLLVLASHTEGLPMVLLEGMAMGLPVVATHVGGVPEVVADGETGLLVPAGEPAAMAQAIIQLLQDEPLRRQMGELGHLRVEKEFAFSRFVRQFQTIYEEVLVTKAHQRV
jgi:glycosyltransferase involved in cell wall biosynthesis